MADNTINHSEQTSTVGEKSLNETPKTISRATLVMVAAGILFVIIAAVVFTKIFNAPTGVPERGSTGTQSSTGQ